MNTKIILFVILLVIVFACLYYLYYKSKKIDEKFTKITDMMKNTQQEIKTPPVHRSVNKLAHFMQENSTSHHQSVNKTSPFAQYTNTSGTKSDDKSSISEESIFSQSVFGGLQKTQCQRLCDFAPIEIQSKTSDNLSANKTDISGQLMSAFSERTSIPDDVFDRTSVPKALVFEMDSNKTDSHVIDQSDASPVNVLPRTCGSLDLQQHLETITED